MTIRLGELGIGLDLGNLRRLELDDVEVAGAVGLEGDRGVLDVDVLDAVELGPALPVVLVGLEGPLAGLRRCRSP